MLFGDLINCISVSVHVFSAIHLLSGHNHPCTEKSW